MTSDFYHDGSRALQKRMRTERLAEHLVDHYVFDYLNDEHIAWIRGADAVFVATVNPVGQPECSYKGGLPGFIHVLDPRTLEIPSYNGNGMYRSLGNASVCPRVGLLFLFSADSAKLRVNGGCVVDLDVATLTRHHGADAVYRVQVREVFENCPRYQHDQVHGTWSPHCPAPGYQPPEPAWKLKPEYDGLLPDRANLRRPQRRR